MVTTDVMADKLSTQRTSPWSALLRGSGKALVIRVLWGVIGYLTILALGNWLTKEDFGIYGFVSSAILLAVAVAGGGAPNMLLRFIAQYRVQERPSSGLGITLSSERLVLISGLAVFVAAVALAVLGQYVGRISNPTPYVLGLAAIPFVALLDVYSAALRGHHYVVWALAPRDILYRAMAIPVAFLATMYFAPEDQLNMIMAGTSVGALVLAAGQALLLRRANSRAYGSVTPEYCKTEWSQVSRPLWVNAVATAVFRSSDVIILGIFLKPEAVGLYFAAAKTADLSRFFLTSLNNVFGPMISSRYYANKPDELQSLCARAAHLVFWPSALVAGTMIAFPAHVLNFVGPHFSDAAGVLVILSIARFADAAFGSVGTMLNITGHQKAAAVALVFTGVGTIAAQLVLIPLYGMMGAALATGGAIVIWNVWLYVIVIRRVGVDPSIVGALRAPRSHRSVQAGGI